ncbi:Homeobox-leucine zipper protein family [Quillaja saponaria]|uniref:Homeobox-leucine zipper protein family n=1 Tax=Quillaja saponaria TaxID=32244 RepID=A0AAD7LHJ1_QUISA|nr:Homeobox-leucine zipper protein family [Quillaja saponaria]
MGTLADVCNTGLGLDLGLALPNHHQQHNYLSDHYQGKETKVIKNNLNNIPIKYEILHPADLTLGPSNEAYQLPIKTAAAAHQQESCSPSAVSSLGSLLASSGIINSDEDDEDDENGSTPSCRKKLRLTKQQAVILEDCFKKHTTLNPQKQELARKLNLRARQVEVWFQNRRARTKLKQNEVDCELLKKCCETLKEENKRLHKELQELKSLKQTAGGGPFYNMQLPAATITMCPACQRLCCGGAGNGSSSSNTFSSKKHSQYSFLIRNNPYTHSSTAS